MSNIIGIVGFKGSGKDTVGNYLVANYGFARDSFASPLKDLVAAVFGWPRHMLEGDTPESREWREQPDLWWEDALSWDKHPLKPLAARFTPRAALQLFGSEVLRLGFHHDLWILSLKARLGRHDRVVITDCRFPNEMKVIREQGGKIIRVRRGPEPEWFDTAEAANSDTFTHAPECAKILQEDLGVHISEYAWVGQEFDAIIENDSDVATLFARVDAVLK